MRAYEVVRNPLDKRPCRVSLTLSDSVVLAAPASQVTDCQATIAQLRQAAGVVLTFGCGGVLGSGLHRAMLSPAAYRLWPPRKTKRRGSRATPRRLTRRRSYLPLTQNTRVPSAVHPVVEYTQHPLATCCSTSCTRSFGTERLPGSTR